MANPVLDSVKEDLKAIKPQIAEAKELISLMKEAGEPTTQLESDVKQLDIRREKWERALAVRGIK